MRISRAALLAALLMAPAAAADAASADGIKVQMKLSCMPNPANQTLGDCKMLSVDPPAMEPVVGPDAIARANGSKMPPNWQTSLAKDGIRVIVPASVMAEPRLGAVTAAPAVTVAPTAAPAPRPAGNTVVVTLSCLPNPDLSVRACQVLSTRPDEPGAAAAALAAVSKGKLDTNWRNIYEVKDGRVIMPVPMTKPAQ